MIMRPPNPGDGRMAPPLERPPSVRPLRPAAAGHPRGSGLGAARAADPLAHDRARSLSELHYIRVTTSYAVGRRQRDLYIGALLGSRLIHPAAYAADPTFRTFLERVPFGIPANPPERVAGAGPRGSSRRRPPRRSSSGTAAYGTGSIHARPSKPTGEGRRTLPARAARLHVCEGRQRSRAQREARAARELAQGLGALDRLVFFNEEDISYRGARQLAERTRTASCPPTSIT